MGHTISSATDMVSYAGDLRRAARQAAVPELSQKIRTSAEQLEKAGLQKAGLTSPALGKLLDILA